MVWMGVEHLGRLEVDKVSRDRMRMYPGGLVGGLGLCKHEVDLVQQRVQKKGRSLSTDMKI
jgi:hypothetical protein